MLLNTSTPSVYGSRGANGVILINTKNGRNSEKMNVSVRLENTFSMPTMVQQVADGSTENDSIDSGGMLLSMLLNTSTPSRMISGELLDPKVEMPRM